MVGLRDSKIISLDEFSQLRETLRKENKKVINCHGVFDLLHPGHIFHLEEAKKLGDILVVSITAAAYVNKGPGRPYFNDELRLKSIAALSCVDYVILSEFTTAHKIIEGVQPDYYVKGSEYSAAENDITGNIDDEADFVRRFGGDVYFTQGDVYSSTKLINNLLGAIPESSKDFLINLSQKYSINDIRTLVDQFKDKKVLVVGDVIIDEYSFCKVQGIMSKDYGFSTRYETQEQYLGGVLAIARHISSFSSHVTVTAMIGDESHIHSRMLNDLSKNMFIDMHCDKQYKTVVKKRYLARKGIRSEYEKLFSVNYLDSEGNLKIDKTDFYEKLKRIVPDFDMVVLTDFGHGLVDETVMNILQDHSKFLALNCQTNSSNYGMNLITKYRRADSYTLDEKELRLACGSNIEDAIDLQKKLHAHFGKSAGCLTLGSEGACAINDLMETVQCPAFTLNVKDTVGAGDAFFAVASLCHLVGAPSEITVFLGNIAGAIAANIMGNAKAVEKVELLKTAATLMNI